MPTTQPLAPTARVSLPILDIEAVALLLCCSVERVYRIPESELPRSHGPGKHCLFLMEDLIDYVRAQTKKQNFPDELTLSERRKVADELAKPIQAAARAKKK